MITKTTAFKTELGVFADLESAQRAEISETFRGLDWTQQEADKATAAILQNKEKILDILTTKENSKVRARKINGGKKKRKSRTSPIINESETEG